MLCPLTFTLQSSQIKPNYTGILKERVIFILDKISMAFTLVLSTFLGCVFIAMGHLDNSRLASVDFSSSVRSVCKPIPNTLSLCHGVGYREMRLPNLLGHDSLKEAQQQSAAWLPLVSKLCHRDTKKFLCSLFAPVCLPELTGPVSPCRGLCEAVRDGCVPVMKAFGFPWPDMFNCSRFPHGTELCIPVTGESNARDVGQKNRGHDEDALKGKSFLVVVACRLLLHSCVYIKPKHSVLCLQEQ